MNRSTLCWLAMLAAAPPVAAAPPSAPGQYVFTLHGGYFYGPGPIVPDTPLPDGSIRGIRFDRDTLAGAAVFAPGGRVLSDGKTVTNGNIDAGALEIGGPQAGSGTASEAGSGTKTGGKNAGKVFWLFAVAGGPNEGQERYRFDADSNMVWTVDLALDPGFPEGIVRVNGFELTTGVRRIPDSLQTAAGQPGGYDKAGSLASGTALIGRVGDFDSDGFMDGTIVASANVPLAADLLPGAPVGNLRGFTTDIPITPLFALELTLRGIANLRPLVAGTLRGGHLKELTERLKDAQERVLAARTNYESAFIALPADQRLGLREVGWRLESIRQLFYIPLAFLTTYEFPTGNAPDSVVDSTTRAFDKAQALADWLERRRQEAQP